MPQLLKPTRQSHRARVLVVDDEPALIEFISEVVARDTNCSLLTARDLREARDIIKNENIDLLLADLNLPDGDGMSLLSQLQQAQPSAAAVIITGQPSMKGAIDAIRAGSFDFLAKPFSADHLLDRVHQALARQAIVARKEKRLGRLKSAVRRLNTIRRTISKKVDLLCNDLVSAYGELSRQVDVIRIEENFRKLLKQSNDLEQLLCHTMDWILRHAGYTNVAVWLASEEQEFELGAYMKYTIPGDKELIEAMKDGLLRIVTRDNFVHLDSEALRDKLTPAEQPFLENQTVMGVNCTYLGESLATVVMFRDGCCPFTDSDKSMIHAISPIFALALANVVRGSEAEDGDTRPFHDHRDEDRREKGTEADWWKRGEAPPF